MTHDQSNARDQSITHSQEETIALAQKLASTFKGGEVLALHGDLGGGKTTFTKGLAEELRVEQNITSPTFVMLKKYDGKTKDSRIEFVHIDAYRAETIEDIKSVGIEDYFERSEKQGSDPTGSYLGRNDVIMVIEWAEKIKEILPENTIDINFRFIDENTREIEIKGINDLNN